MHEEVNVNANKRREGKEWNGMNVSDIYFVDADVLAWGRYLESINKKNNMKEEDA